MYQIQNMFDNQNMKLIASAGQYFVYEYQDDKSVSPYTATTSYFMQKMNVKKRQVLVQLNNTSTKVQAGAMQWMLGNVNMDANVGGVGGFAKGLLKGMATGETLAKPVYSGQGFMMMEPTYNYILVEDVGSWGAGMVLDDGMFLACDTTVQDKVVKRQNLSSAIAGGEGLFNTCLTGQGYAVLESCVPREELIEFDLQDDVLKIDGNMAVAWSASLQFTVEKSTKGLLNSAISKEGFVNVYRGTGKVLMAPVMNGTVHYNNDGPEQTSANSSHGLFSSVAGSVFNA